ncbi:MAG: GPP34 family phosphoprotein [Phycisphaerae bacterium]
MNPKLRKPGPPTRCRPRPERKLIERLRKAIFTETRQVDPRTVILVSLASAADLLRIPFDKKALKTRKDRIERLVSGELMGRATREAFQAAQAAVTVACVTPAITAATITH